MAFARPRPYQLTPTVAFQHRGSIQFRPSYYRGSQNQTPQILYIDNYAKSEQYARQFLTESDVGFDLEWAYPPPRDPELQDLVSTIQVASEDKIAIFHIGRHDGSTSGELIAPSLRALIEDRAIRKTGQSIMGDFSRLSRYFELVPRGALELSNLHRLIGPDRDPWNFKTIYIKGGLKTLTETYLRGFSLRKGSDMHQISVPLSL